MRAAPPREGRSASGPFSATVGTGALRVPACPPLRPRLPVRRRVARPSADAGRWARSEYLPSPLAAACAASAPSRRPCALRPRGGRAVPLARWRHGRFSAARVPRALWEQQMAEGKGLAPVSVQPCSRIGASVAACVRHGGALRILGANIDAAYIRRCVRRAGFANRAFAVQSRTAVRRREAERAHPVGTAPRAVRGGCGATAPLRR